MEPPKPPEQPHGEKKEGFFNSLSLLQKIILFVVILAFVFLLAGFVLGGLNSVWEFVFVFAAAIVLFVIVYVVIVAGKIIFQKEYFSPKEDWFTKLVNCAIDYKPDNLNNLYFRGDDWKKMVLAGRIIGCIGVPYFVGKPLLDDNGVQIFYESPLLKKRKLPKFSSLTYGKDGDTVFVVEKGFFIFKKRHVIRCHHDLHSDLNGDVYIDDINPQPYGQFWEYPYKQLHANVSRVQVQSQMETILATYEYQGDLISMSAEAGVRYNPYLSFVREQQAQVVATK